MKRQKRVPRPCVECGKDFIPPRKTSRFCSVACRRAVDVRVCKNGHDLTLPGACRVQRKGPNGKLVSRCIKCEYEATKRYRRKKGILPRDEYLEGARKDEEHHRARNRRNAEKHRRLRGVQPRQKRTVSSTVRTEVTAAMHVKRELPYELSKAWGRAGHGSQMRRKFPTRESLVAAYARGEVPEPPSSRLEP